MARATPAEIRERIIEHKQNGATEKDISKWLLISESTVTKVWSLYRKTGSIAPRERAHGRKALVSDETMAKVTEQIAKTPDITLKELIALFELPITESALSKRLIKLNYTFKKRLFTPLDENAPMLLKNGNSGGRTKGT